MARTKYTFEKRQREIAKKQKREEKAARRAEAKQRDVDAAPEIPTEEQPGTDPGEDTPSAG
ncbi:MAG: hypothetical protein LLG93_14845 [Deltaproteobacteria bacterium]|nr:hypothetical protein [Deltaproteobacteria bacterium]